MCYRCGRVSAGVTAKLEQRDRLAECLCPALAPLLVSYLPHRCDSDPRDDRQFRGGRVSCAHSCRQFSPWLLGPVSLNRNVWKGRILCSSQKTGSKERDKKGPGTGYPQSPAPVLLPLARPYDLMFPRLPKPYHQQRPSPQHMRLLGKRGRGTWYPKHKRSQVFHLNFSLPCLSCTVCTYSLCSALLSKHDKCPFLGTEPTGSRVALTTSWT